jgi:proteasome lid subunit RPN8/RPN11
MFKQNESKISRRIKALKKSGSRELSQAIQKSGVAASRFESRTSLALRELRILSGSIERISNERRSLARSGKKGEAIAAGGELLFLRAKSVSLQSDVYLSWMQQLHHERAEILYKRILNGDDIEISLRELFDYPNEIVTRSRNLVDHSSIIDIDWRILLAEADEEHYTMALREVSVVFPEPVSAFMRDAIEQANENEVFFVSRVRWDKEGLVAEVDEVEVAARGNAGQVPAIVGRDEKWDLVIHNHPGGNLDPSEADLNCATIFSADNIGFAIINNDATEHYLVVKPNPHGLEDR